MAVVVGLCIHDSLAVHLPVVTPVLQVRPVADESQLAELPTLPPSALRPEFRKDVDSLRRKILSTVHVKTVFGKEVNGAMLAELAIAYCAALNDNAAPTISTAWERVVERQCTVLRGS
jgi:hypothetical protein